jgi:hypothetical protein
MFTIAVQANENRMRKGIVFSALRAEKTLFLSPAEESSTLRPLTSLQRNDCSVETLARLRALREGEAPAEPRGGGSLGQLGFGRARLLPSQA